MQTMRSLMSVGRRGLQSRAFSNSAWTKGNSLYEIRTYQLKPEHLMEYLALTGSDKFAARTNASKLNAFFNVELGGVLCNSVVHFWRYESLDHRTEVRNSLAGDKGFGEYITTIRPWLVSQDSVLTRGRLDEALVESKAPMSGKYLLEKNSSPVDYGSAIASGLEVVGEFQTIVGPRDESYALIRGNSFQELLDGTEGIQRAPGSGVLLHPTAFSPAM